MKFLGMGWTKLDEQGLTLIEILITLVVFGIVIASLSTLYYEMEMSQVNSTHYELAVNAARTEIEDLRNNGYSSLSSSSPPSFNSNLLAGLPSNAQGSVTVSDPMPNLKEVNVTITYSDYGQSETVILSSDIGVIGISSS